MNEDELKDILNKLYEYYGNINCIEEYLLSRKKERIEDIKIDDSLIFNLNDISPYDMDFSIEEIDNRTFTDYTQSISTSIIENQLGRKINFIVKEKNTNKIVGFIRLSSPSLMMKPRSDLFGCKINSSIVNNYIINSSILVPVQPFGFNYLGGKLLALISTSNELKNIFNNKYNTNISLFETTSLYGSVKNISQYDGLEPFIKYSGNTEGRKLEYPSNEVYKPLLKRMRDLYGKDEYGGRLWKKGSSPKQTEFNKFIGLLKSETKKNDVEEFKRFEVFIKEKMFSYTKKRYYISKYGIQNIKDVLLNGIEPIYMNEHKYNLDYVIDWWKKKSFNRWSNLSNKNELKNKLEYYTKDNIDKIDFKIIR